MHSAGHALASPWLSPDKQRLYALDLATGAVIVATRSSRSAPFGPPAEVPGARAELANGLAIASDEREIFLARADLPMLRATRASPSEPFGALEPVTISVALPHYHPTLSPDGTELFFVSSAAGSLQVHRAMRSERGAPFDPATVIDLGVIGDTTPTLAGDGLWLTFSRGGFTHYALRERTDLPFGAASALPIPTDGAHYFPFVSIATRELFYIATTRAWDPIPASTLVRAELCFDGACPARPLLSCTGGVLSPDGAHCYLGFGTPLPWDGARRDCEARGGHLASLHSGGEIATLLSIASGPASWTGAMDRDDDPTCADPATDACGYAWESAEPFLGIAWRAGEPSGTSAEGAREACVALASDGAMEDRACGEALGYVCEIDAPRAW